MVERLRLLRTKVKDNIQEVIDTMPQELKQTLDANEAVYKELQSEEAPVLPNLLFLLFFRPDLVAQIQHATIDTMDSFLKAVRNKFRTDSEESAFFINHHPGVGITTTLTQQKFAHIGSPVRKYESVEDPDRQTVAFFHTHPPALPYEVLKPSTIHEAQPGSGQYQGDLYSFLAMRRMRREAEAEGVRPSFARRPLFIIMHQSMLDASGKMLFIREGTALNDLGDEEYKAVIEQNRDPMIQAKTEDGATSLLRNMGFNTSYLTVPEESLYSYPMIDSEDDYGRLNKELFEE